MMLKEGINTITYPNGKPYIKCNIRNNKKNGPYEEYYENGLIKYNGIILYNYYIGSIWFYYSNKKTSLYVYDCKINIQDIHKESEYLKFSYIRYDTDGNKIEEKIKNLIGYTINIYNKDKTQSINYINEDNFHIIQSKMNKIIIINNNDSKINLDYYNSKTENTIKLTNNNLIIYDKQLNKILDTTFKNIYDIHEPDILLELGKNKIIKQISKIIPILQNNLFIQINLLDNNDACDIILKCIELLKNINTIDNINYFDIDFDV